jgi:hypothetical protein
MAYRRESGPSRRWQQWKKRNEAALARCGLPEAVLRDERSWWNYLEHGYLHHFRTEDLSRAQMEALYDLLSTEVSEDERRSAQVWLHLTHLLGERA